MRTYKIRKYMQGKSKGGGPYSHYSLTVPTNIAEQLPENMQFQIELTDDGILFRPIGQARDIAELLPAWARPDEDSNEDGPEDEYVNADQPVEDPEPKPKSNARARKRPARSKAVAK